MKFKNNSYLTLCIFKSGINLHNYYYSSPFCNSKENDYEFNKIHLETKLRRFNNSNLNTLSSVEEKGI